MSSTAEVTVQPTNDPNVQAYHTRFEMSSGPESGTRGNSEEMGAFGNLILDIKGIAQLHICPYIMLVTKGPLFEWSEIEPEIKKILASFAISQRQLQDVFADNNPKDPVPDLGVGVPKTRVASPRAIRKSF